MNDYKNAAAGDREPTKFPADRCDEPGCEYGWIVIEREVAGELITGVKPCPRCGGAR